MNPYDVTAIRSALINPPIDGADNVSVRDIEDEMSYHDPFFNLKPMTEETR